MKFDKIVEAIAGLGVPGLVLCCALALTGFAGAAALTTALASLGGPLGMLGGIGVLLFLVLISKALSKWGIEKIAEAVKRRLIEKGETKESILEKIESYRPISKELKLKIKDYVVAVK